MGKLSSNESEPEKQEIQIVLKKYRKADNIQLEKIGDKSGLGIDIAVNGDFYSYAFLMHLNP